MSQDSDYCVDITGELPYPSNYLELVEAKAVFKSAARFGRSRIMLIRNYGLYWGPDLIFWGRPKVNGTLLGVKETKKLGKPVDFAEQVGIYILYRDYSPVYVGQTGAKKQKLLKRLRNHGNDHLAGRWDGFSWFGVIPVTKAFELRKNLRVTPSLSDALNHVEAVLIAAMEPPLNLQRGRFGGAEQYLQAKDSRLPPTDGDKITETLERIQRLEAQS